MIASTFVDLCLAAIIVASSIVGLDLCPAPVIVAAL
jgi:hypothetical protein